MADREDIRPAKPGEKRCAFEGCHLIPYQESEYCKRHSGAAQMHQLRQKKLRNYILTRTQLALDIGEKSHAPEAQSLRDEIAIMRYMLEKQLNQVKDDTDLTLRSGTISKFVFSLEKLVSSSIRAERSLGDLLSIDTIKIYQDHIINAIESVVTDPDLCEKIAIAISEIDLKALTVNALRDSDQEVF
jgi:hypothetical protein